MIKLHIGRDSRLAVSVPSEFLHREATACEGVVVLGRDFKSGRRERVYDADKVWSGEHAIRDYTEI